MYAQDFVGRAFAYTPVRWREVAKKRDLYRFLSVGNFKCDVLVGKIALPSTVEKVAAHNHVLL